MKIFMNVATGEADTRHCPHAAYHLHKGLESFSFQYQLFFYKM